MAFVDLTGRHTAISIVGAPVAGVSGTAFNGNSCIVISDGGSDFTFGSAPWTIEFTSNVAQSAQGMGGNFTAIDVIAGNAGWAFYGPSGNRNAIGFRSSPGGGDSALSIPAGAEHATALTFDGTTLRAFVDGVLQTSVSRAGWNYVFGGKLTLGGYGGGAGFPGLLRNVRITRACRYVANYTPPAVFPTGADDPYWNSTVLLMTLLGTPAGACTISSMSKDTSVPGDWVTWDGSPGRTISGTVSAALGVGEAVRVSSDGGSSWVYATVSGLGWTAVDVLTHAAGWTISAQVYNPSSGLSGITASQPVTLISAPVCTIAGMADSTGAPVGWSILDGSPGRTISGTVSAALGVGESVQISMDGGISWAVASVSGLAWSIVDMANRAASWSIWARVVSAAGYPGPIASQPVIYTSPAAPGDFDPADDLPRAVVNSLFSWRRAAVDDDLPAPGVRNGWWGDSYASITGDQFGSRLWLLARAKSTPQTLAAAQEYAQEALQWLIDDGVAARVAVLAEYQGLNNAMLAMAITIYRHDGQPRELRFDNVWSFLL